ncbi:MAG TPA: hypothetical protein VM328_06950 [Fimbriimonadaceae bacterium]|nr:hypothetical protein [Fimbriimonadaceae bacterium]
MKVIGPRFHGVIDYLACLVFFLAPSLFNFGGVPATISYIAGAGYLLVTLMTDMPYGLARVIPFPAHGAIEIVVALALLAMPWLAGFNDVENARNFFVAMGVLTALVWMMTDWRRTYATDYEVYDRDRDVDEDYPRAA